MLARSSVRYLALLYISDILATLGSLFLAVQSRHAIPLGKAPTQLGEPTLATFAVVAIIWSVTFLFLSVYNSKAVLNPLDEAQKVIVAATASLLVLAGALFFTNRGLSRLLLGYFYVLDVLLMIIMRMSLRIVIKSLAPHGITPRKVLIVGAGAVGQDLARRAQRRTWLGLDVIGYLDDDPDKIGKELEGYPVLAPLSKAKETIEKLGVNEVVIALPLWAHATMRDLVIGLQELPVNIKVIPDFFALTLFSARMEDLDGIPLIGLKEPVIDGSARVVKRLMDLVIGSLTLLALSPLMVATAILVKLDSKGPVLYKPTRVGENGLLFKMFKFRTMYVGSEKKEADLLKPRENGQLIFDKRRDDPRVTRVGKYLRSMSLDELPQLFNVLRGDMSLVGPRPEMPFLVKLYEPWQRRRFSVPQGMTGWWQVNDRSDKPMQLHTDDDLYYIQNYSLKLDLQILWRTIGAVLRRRGAY